MTNKINHLAVWILVIVHLLIGWGWYAIFGEKWLNLHARTMTDIERTHNVGAYVLAIVTAIIVNYALAWLIARRECHERNCRFESRDALLVCLLVRRTRDHRRVLRLRNEPWPLILIDMGRPFVNFAISGLVLGAWRRPRVSRGR